MIYIEEEDAEMEKKKLLIYAHYYIPELHQLVRFSVNLRKECWASLILL